MISLSGAVMVVFYLIIAGLIFWLLWWVVGYIGFPQPFDKVLRVVIVLLAVAVLIGFLLSAVGGQPLFRA